MSHGCIDLVSDLVFGATLWKLLIIEPIFSMKIKFKIDTENCIEIWGHSWCVVVGKVSVASQI
jgi:hypothetical protein